MPIAKSRGLSLTSVLDDRARPGYAGQDDVREGTHGTLRGRSSPREKAATGQKWTLSDTFQRLIPIGPFISTGIPRPDANMQSSKWQEMTGKQKFGSPRFARKMSFIPYFPCRVLTSTPDRFPGNRSPVLHRFQPSFRQRCASALTDPVTIGAVVLLFVNDLVLKQLWQNSRLTGKLSDFAFSYQRDRVVCGNCPRPPRGYGDPGRGPLHQRGRRRLLEPGQYPR